MNPRYSISKDGSRCFDDAPMSDGKPPLVWDKSAPGWKPAVGKVGELIDSVPCSAQEMEAFISDGKPAA
jgi:hypothetical protein